MKAAGPHPQEEQRLKSLQALEILDTINEAAYDEITQLASTICKSPIAMVSLVDKNRQWFKSVIGLTVQETPREQAFCAYTILQDQVFEVPDAHQNTKFVDNPLVTGHPNIRFYAGAPVLSPDNYPIGTLCVIDHVQRTLSEEQRSALLILSRQISRLLKLRQMMVSEEKRIRSEYELARMRFLGEMTAGISHEINTPLAIILGNTHQMSQFRDALNGISSDLSLRLEKIDRSAHRISNVVKGLKEFGKSEGSVQESQFTVGSLFESLVESFSEQAAKQNVSLTWEKLNNEATLKTHRTDLERAFKCLIVNALEAVKNLPEKWVKLSVELNSKTVKLTVTDSGNGVDPVTAASMMQAFFTTAPLGQKLGIGLSIAKSLIEANGGQLEYNSHSKQTQFSVILPRLLGESA